MLLPSAVLTHKTGGASGFVPNGLDFYHNGSGVNYIQNTALTGVPNGTTGSFSCWFQFQASSGVEIPIKQSTTQYVFIGRDSSNNTTAVLFNSAKTNSFTINGTTPVSDNNWHNLLIAWDTGHGAGSKIGTMYIDGVTASPSNSDGGAGPITINYAGDTVALGTNEANDPIFLSEIWYYPNNFIDFTVSANRALFYNAGNAVNLGSNGQTPTGSSPPVYIHNAAATCNLNLGTGGDFAINGTITDTSPPP